MEIECIEHQVFIIIHYEKTTSEPENKKAGVQAPIQAPEPEFRLRFEVPVQGGWQREIFIFFRLRCCSSGFWVGCKKKPVLLFRSLKTGACKTKSRA